MKYRIFVSACYLSVFSLHAEQVIECDTDAALSTELQTVNQVPLKIEQLNIVTHPIFNENDPDTVWLHHFANWLHVETKPEVIAERLPFAIGDSVNDLELAEAERIVRKLPYVRDARIHTVPTCLIGEPLTVEIESWDNWSLVPTISFGRKGGKNKGSIGIKEDNLLGLGIRTRFKYNSDDQRTGYQFTVESATPYLMPYSSVLIDFFDNDDGNLLNIAFERPFYHAKTDSMYFASYLSDDKVVDIYQNGGTRNSFISESHRYELATGWQLDSTLLHSQRIKVGVVDEEYRFFNEALNPANPELIPLNRRHQYVWLGYESLQRDFRTMSDIYLIEQTEDINLGLHYELKLGLDFASQDQNQGLGYHLEASVAKGWQIDKALLLVSASALGGFNQDNNDHYSLSANGEYFKRFNRLFAVYGRLTAASEHNPYLDLPQSVGDDSGVRGYPLQYQHGDHSLSASLEARMYTGYNIYKILDVGFAAFADAGRAWGGSEAQLNETDQLLSSVGVGARLYSSRASHQNVIHIDIVKPLASSDNVDSWQWRLQVKESF